jgi:hypothetical protein
MRWGDAALADAVVRMLCAVPSDRLYSAARQNGQHQVGGGGLRSVYAAGRRPLYRLKTPESRDPGGGGLGFHHLEHSAVTAEAARGIDRAMGC